MSHFVWDKYVSKDYRKTNLLHHYLLTWQSIEAYNIGFYNWWFSLIWWKGLSCRSALVLMILTLISWYSCDREMIERHCVIMINHDSAHAHITFPLYPIYQGLSTWGSSVWLSAILHKSWLTVEACWASSGLSYQNIRVPDYLIGLLSSLVFVQTPSWSWCKHLPTSHSFTTLVPRPIGDVNVSGHELCIDIKWAAFKFL